MKNEREKKKKKIEDVKKPKEQVNKSERDRYYNENGLRPKVSQPR